MSVPSPSSTFLAAHPEIQTGRATLSRLQSANANDDSFSIINKPFPNMILHQEFDADTRERIFVVALIDDQKALDDYARDRGEADEGERCDCKEDHGPEHLIYERVVEYKKAECEEHGRMEQDPDCSACWPVLCGSKCTFA
jgi:hypothetical protein